MFRKIFKYFIPPIVTLVYRKIVPHKTGDLLWTGNFRSWDQAMQRCEGYDSPMILEKTKDAVLKVKKGEAVFERDTVLFYKPEYNWSLLTILFKSAGENNGKASVLDFGGSLGSSYFQNKAMLKNLIKLEWSIIEQPNYIDLGNELFSDEILKFYENVEVCQRERKPKVLLLSGVIHYLDYPYKMISNLFAFNFDYIIVARTTFIDNASERLTVQRVPKNIYDSSYPAWFLNREKFLDFFKEKYALLADFESYPGYTINIDNEATGRYYDFIFKRAQLDA